MIVELRIRDLGVIAEAVVPFGPGLTVVTGETGAGKTMVLTGLDLVSGGRADAGLVRAGARRADVDAEWRPSAATFAAVQDRLADAGAESVGDDAAGDDAAGPAVLLGRTVLAEGRSRAIAGGRTVPAGVLADVAAALVVVHGQADQFALRDARRQRELLDAFARAETTRRDYGVAFDRWRATSARLRELVDRRVERDREAALLRHGIAEIAAVAPIAGEDVDLKATASALGHATDLLADLAAAHAAITGGDEADAGILALVARARQHLDRVQAIDPRAGDLTEATRRLSDAAAALGAEIAAQAATIDADPARLAQVEERRHALGELKRRYGPDLDDVLAWWAQAEETVAQADDVDARIEALRTTQAEAERDLRAVAQRLTAVRRSAADRLGSAVTAELADLAMPDAVVAVRVESAAEPAEWTADGADTVQIVLTAHAGAPARPIGRGASGGELSRLMLAIEVVLAGVSAVPTMVFDEVDAGIGGLVAVEVGRRLARLARSVQVIVVTHLPQVAAFADHHVVVTKGSDGQVTAASVVAVTGSARVRELTRMLAGLPESQSGAEHAAELLDLAASDRRSAATAAKRRRSARASR